MCSNKNTYIFFISENIHLLHSVNTTFSDISHNLVVMIVMVVPLFDVVVVVVVMVTVVHHLMVI